jgi:hypothetical protein
MSTSADDVRPPAQATLSDDADPHTAADATQLAQNATRRRRRAAAQAGSTQANRPANAPTATDATRGADEQAIRDAAAAYVKAYNAGDAKALAAMFTPQARIVDGTGQSVRGREEIERLFSRMFEESPGTQIENNVDTIEFIGRSPG